jgi:nucleotide-binding universal stress UspA family protein
MKSKKKITSFLIPVDDWASSQKLVSFVAELGRSCGKSIDVTLFHLLELPPRVLEHGGAEDPQEERERDAALALEREEWIAQAKRRAQPVFEKARQVLQEANVSERNIHQMYSTTVHGRLSQEALEAAGQRGCGTIIVGRHNFSWFEELTRSHVADKLVKQAEGIAICVVQ